MKFTVLGSSGAWPAAGRACSGYLLESGGTHLVLDLGFGALPRLLERCPAADVGAVFVTHAHADHCVDLFGLYRARALPKPAFPPLPIHAPPEVLHRVGALDGPDGPSRLRRECDFHPIGPGQTVEVGPFRVRTFALPHFVPDLGFRVEVDGVVIAYTGDTGPSPRLVELARGADLFVCEATYQGAPPEGVERFLLTASEAGRYAREAGVARLMLTHFWPEDVRTVSRTEAAREFSGEVLLAEE
ncbi:MAG: MBL fold metallo-hydrolase, partial [Thermoplasmata archaeon]